MLAYIDRWTRAFALKVWQLGLLGALRYTLRYLLNRKNRAKTNTALRRDLLKTYSMVNLPLQKAAMITATPEVGTMNWIIPPFSIGSGGHLNIFRMISMLEERGFKVRIYIVGEHTFSSTEKIRKLIDEHFVPIKGKVFIGTDEMLPAEFVVATSWDTAYWAYSFQSCAHKIYFVQDFEPFFYPHGSEYAFAEETYKFGFKGITAGQWLADTLNHKYGMITFPFGFSYDKHIYYPRQRNNGPRRVFFYARHVTPRRGFELGILALNLLHKTIPEVEFVLAGWDASEFHIPFPHLNAGVVPIRDLPLLYSQCDLALVLSFTNLSLLPLEIMACGCPVVSNRGPNTEWLLTDGENALLCDPTPQDIAAKLERLLMDEQLRNQLIQRGLDFAQKTDWQKEGDRVSNILHQIRKQANRQP